MIRHLLCEKDMSTLRALIKKCSQVVFSFVSGATVISAFRNKCLSSNLVYTSLHIRYDFDYIEILILLILLYIHF